MVYNKDMDKKMNKEEEYYTDLEKRIENQRTSRELELDIIMYIEKESRQFKKTFYDSFYRNIENRKSRKFLDSLDYMNCILEETLHQYRGRK
jgi:hypothetical protein